MEGNATGVKPFRFAFPTKIKWGKKWAAKKAKGGKKLAMKMLGLRTGKKERPLYVAGLKEEKQAAAAAGVLRSVKGSGSAREGHDLSNTSESSVSGRSREESWESWESFESLDLSTDVKSASSNGIESAAVAANPSLDELIRKVHVETFGRLPDETAAPAKLSGVAVCDTEEKGKVVVATRDFKAGEIIMEEEPTCTLSRSHIPPRLRTSEIDQFIRKHAVEEIIIYFPLYVLSRPKGVQDAFFTLFCPTELTSTIGPMSALLAPSKQLGGRCLIDTLVLPPGVDRVLFKRALVITNVNALDSGFDNLSGCSNATGGGIGEHRRTFVALEDVAKGTELTISYLNDRKLMRATHVRQKLLWTSKYFLCKCALCVQRPDPRRAFKCSGCGAMAFLVECEHLKHRVYGAGSCPIRERHQVVGGESFVCKVCDSYREIDLEEQKRLVQTERDLERYWLCFGSSDYFAVDARRNLTPVPTLSAEDLEAAASFLREARGTLGSGHWIRAEMDRLHFDLLIANGKVLDARGPIVRRVGFIMRVYGRPTMELVRLNESLAKTSMLARTAFERLGCLDYQRTAVEHVRRLLRPSHVLRRDAEHRLELYGRLCSVLQEMRKLMHAPDEEQQRPEAAAVVRTKMEAMRALIRQVLDSSRNSIRPAPAIRQVNW